MSRLASNEHSPVLPSKIVGTIGKHTQILESTETLGMDFLRTARNYIVYVTLYLEYTVSFETTTLGNSGRLRI